MDHFVTCQKLVCSGYLCECGYIDYQNSYLRTHRDKEIDSKSPTEFLSDATENDKDRFYSLFEQKVQTWPKVQPKTTKIASPSMKIYTRITTLASIRKSSVFFSYDWSPVAKNEDLFNKFHQGLYGKSWKNSLKAQTSVQKRQ